jgi:stearoyl-CoA desaturase (delta-9 desaturase)
MYEGLLQLPWWGYAIVALVLTHITIAAVTIYLHRYQTHMALDLHPAVSHFFRFWLWLTTGMRTKEWVAIHRKHHANVETARDPHSPIVKGINKVLWGGWFLYREESLNTETLEKYGAGTPDDWLERNVYTEYANLSLFGMLAIEIVLFGPLAGGLIWVTQMLWIPFWAAGVINGIGHYWGYRNFEVKDASKNIVPWGIIIGGEELHNNHHAYASSARFSNKKWEFDLGWQYIRLLRALGLAKVKKLAPTLVLSPEKHQFDRNTAKVLINSRFQVMSNFAKDVLNNVLADELKRPGVDHKHRVLLRRARRLMRRESSLLNDSAKAQLKRALDISPSLSDVYAMKQKLQTIWAKPNNLDGLLQALEEWCRAAEASGIEALQEFSDRLRRYQMAPA